MAGGTAQLSITWNRDTSPVSGPAGAAAPAGSIKERFENIEQVLATHFADKHQHWSKKVLVDAGNVTINGDVNETILKRIGTQDATVTLEPEDFVDGDLVYLDNVFENSGTLTLTSTADIYVESSDSSKTHTLTGKGQMELVFYSDAFYITNLVR